MPCFRAGCRHIVGPMPSSPIRKLRKTGAVDQDGNVVTIPRLPSVVGSNKPPDWNRWSPAEKAEHLLGLNLDGMHEYLSWPADDLDPYRLAAQTQVIRVVAMVAAKVGVEARRDRERQRILEPPRGANSVPVVSSRICTGKTCPCRRTLRGLEMTRMVAFALGLALTAAAFTARAAEQQQPPNAQTTAPPEPRSCQQLHEETNKCETGMRSCDQRVIARLEAQCQRDVKRLPQVLGPREGGRP